MLLKVTDAVGLLMLVVAIGVYVLGMMLPYLIPYRAKVEFTAKPVEPPDM